MKKEIADYPITIVKNDTFVLTFTKNTKDCSTQVVTPVDLTGASVEAKIVDKSNAEEIQFTSSVSDPTAGEITISLSPDISGSGSLTGVSVKQTEHIGRYFVRLTYTDGTVETVLKGDVTLISNEGL